jgi:hypothetical protein
MNTAAVGLKEAKTSVQKADVIAAVNKAAQDALTGKELEAEFIIKDVQMLSADKARITVSSLNTPVYSKQPKSISLNLAGTWDLPLTTDKARTIEPGQHLLLRGPAAFSPTEGILSLSMPRPNAMARITYIGDAPGAFHGGVLTLAPKKYAITRP